ncbi:HAD-IIIA family hydrolase [Cupriavidus sp. BIC8F]|uniref:HAD-IIIA family hydrolase n=1 Tax=Cupriavidus sp. BIC8F TaxID=3079014 RepID=UPI0029164725|nr:HAD-IIIA family hydrolase [Cupriavidus sp. BIC8F]
MKQVVILAGGKGTRLRERLGDLPKPLIDVCGVPLLERQVLLAKRYGFNRVLILVNYRAERIAEYCASKANWGLEIQCIDDGEPRGTAGAVLQLLDQLDDEFLLMYGDTMLEVDLDRFHRYHAEGGDVAATLFLHPNDHPQDSDLVEIDEWGNVSGFHPYPHDSARYYPNLVNAALYWIRKSALEPWRGHAGMLDFGKELFPAMIGRGMTLRGYNSPEYIKDCGTPSRIDKVSADFMSGRIHRAALDIPQMAVFVDRDGTLNREMDHLNEPGQLELLAGVELAVRRLNRSEYRVCVVTNQPVVARGECTPESLRQIHNKLETLLGQEGAYVDRIYYCPHHPDKGFAGEVPELKIDCDCRKPKTGMIEAAVAELNIAKERSWMIGDTTSDLLAAQRAGVRSILVETGYAGLEQKYWVTPDYIVPDFPAAVAFILEIYPGLMERIAPLAHGIEAGSIVFVGGQSRSGKSTFASVLRDTLQNSGKRCHVISTDRWLLSEAERGQGVLGRHDMHALEAAIRSVDPSARPASLSLPGYRKLKRQQVQAAEELQVHPGEIIIVEGVVALTLAEALDAKHRFFVEIDEAQRRERVVREYILRGVNEVEALRLYEERYAEEVPVVAGPATTAILFRIAGVTSNGKK